MKIEVTEGEKIFLEMMRRIKEKTALEFNPDDKIKFLKTNMPEITRYIIYEILRGS